MLSMKSGKSLSPTGDCVLAIIAASIAIALSIALRYEFSGPGFAEPVAEHANFLFYLGAVIACAHFGGRRAGLLCLALTLLANLVLFWAGASVQSSWVAEAISAAILAALGMAICFSYGAMHRALALRETQVLQGRQTEEFLLAEIEHRAASEKDIGVLRTWLKTTLASIGDAAILIDEHERIISMNPVAERLTGWSERVEGQYIKAVFTLLDEKTRLPVENPVSKVISTAEVVRHEQDTLLVDKSGVEYPVESSAAPMFGTDGHVAGVVLVFRDVSARRRADREMQRLLSELREADRLKDEFLALLAHELRNPLAPIRSAIDIVRMGDKAAVKNACDILQRQVANMARLVDDLLQISRITHNQLEMRKVYTDLAPILRDALEISRPLIEAKSHRLVEEIPSGPMPVHADPTRLAQLFANLLNNAAKFTDPGGEVALMVERNPDRVVIAVSDTGMGIPRGMEDKIFQLFTQLDTGLSRSQGGLGIGLTLVQRIVQMHGGSVRVARTEDPGTTFMVELPLSLSYSQYSSTVPVGPEVNTKQNPDESGPLSLRVLVVDDNHDAAESMAVLLNILGSEVRVCHDGIEAVEAFSDFRPQAILLDIGLPRLDGYGAAEQIRALPGGDAVTLIALSGYGRDDDRRRSREAGFDHHLVKPIAPDTLINLLAPVVGSRQVSDAEVP
ncbi:MAG: tmoS [Rhodocyclales bacterium]|nr:tmoS [Rhodocyclales bacterium]